MTKALRMELINIECIKIMEMYKGWRIEQNDLGYWEATNTNDCDVSMIFAKYLFQVMIEIDELDD
jgi:hypothetical protein